MSDPILLPDWTRAYGPPPACAVLRGCADDFVVDEELGYAPDGDGEHVLLHLRKRDSNTDWVAQQIQALAQVRPVDVGFAGLKDRHALTTQWFSVALRGQAEPDWSALNSPQIQVLTVARHRQKLQRGDLAGNRFTLRLTALAGEQAAVAERLAAIRAGGVPNYFGEQRFGHDGNNLLHAQALFGGRVERDRHRRGLYLSAARSLLFNHVLQARVEAGSWNRALAGEALMWDTDPSHSFVAFVLDEVTARRVAAGEVHPTGPLWGRGRQPVKGAVAALEAAVLAPFADWCAGLEQAGLNVQRRPLRLPVRDLAWEFEAADRLLLSFRLDAGSYATAVVREVAATGAA